MIRELNMIILLIFLSFIGQTQNDLVKEFVNENCKYILILKPNGIYTLTHTVSNADNIIQPDNLSSGIWRNSNDTLILQDTVYPERNTNRRQYQLIILDEYKLINLSLKCFARNDTLKVTGLRDNHEKRNNNGQNIDVKMINGPIDIEKLIKLKEDDKQQQTLLIKFRNYYRTDDNISVEEFQNYYKIIVDHPDVNGHTGGAECYKVYKKTGESEMIWHEHPMKLPEEIKEE